jgi:hypothetical protein
MCLAVIIAVSFVTTSREQWSVGLEQPDCGSPAVQTHNNNCELLHEIEQHVDTDDVLPDGFLVAVLDACSFGVCYLDKPAVLDFLR